MVKQSSQKKAAVSPSKTTPRTRSAIDEMIAEDADQAPPPDVLARLNGHAQELEQHYTRLAQASLVAEDATKQIQRIETEVLPSLMDEAHTKKITLDGGVQFERAERVFASVSKANAAKAAAWLIKAGYGSIVKMGFNIEVPKGDVKLQTKIKGILAKAKIKFGELTGVHPQTLLAFVKESLEAGRKLPSEISVHTQGVVKVTFPKKESK